MSAETPDEESALRHAFAAGDRAAFEVLFRRYTPPLLAFLGRMLRDPARAEDLAQEAFVRVYQAQARGRYTPSARFSTYLFKIAHNLALNELQRAHRTRERPLDPDVDTASRVEPTAEEWTHGQAAQAALERGLDALPERQRTALLLRVDQRLGYDAIAEVLQTTQSSVKSLIHRARTALVASLKDGRGA